jgi:hypothetical protein
MGYGFFRDDDGPHEDRDYVPQFIGAVKLGVLLANVCVFPFFLLGKVIETAAARSAAQKAANGPPRTAPPPGTQPPPHFHQQAPPPPPPPPASDPLEKYRIILGVKPGANKEEVKKRYRFLCQLYHPDKVTPELRAGAGEEFHKLHEAYTVLYAIAPDAPPKPRAQPQARPAEATRPSPEPARPEPERPRPATNETPLPQGTSAKEQPQPKAATTEPKPAQPGWKRPPYSKPKYF